MAPEREKERRVGIVQSTRRSVVGGNSGEQLKDRRSKDLMMLLGLNDTVGQLAMENNICWYGHVLRRSLDFKVEGHRKKGRPKRTWKKQVEEESVKVGLRREDTLC